MSDKLPIDDPEYWSKRIQKGGYQHEFIYATSQEDWDLIQRTHKALLGRILNRYKAPRILDGGCGYGALLEIMPTEIPIHYAGVDLSPDMITLARNNHPDKSFRVGTLERLPFPSRSFDIAICRSIDGMVKENLGISVWRNMETELLRVADTLILLQYTNPQEYIVVDAVADTCEMFLGELREEYGFLTYRVGKDGSCEMYDLFVEENYRLRGIATRLIERLSKETWGGLYGFVRPNNEHALSLYRKLGFRLIYLTGFYRGQDAIMILKPAIEDGGLPKITTGT